jgi:hypothetical protein
MAAVNKRNEFASTGEKGGGMNIETGESCRGNTFRNVHAVRWWGG